MIQALLERDVGDDVVRWVADLALPRMFARPEDQGRCPLSFRYSLPAPMRRAVVFLTQSALVFRHSSQPDGSFFCTNMFSRSLTETVGSPSSSRASGLLARKANNRPNSPAEPTKLSSPSNLVSFCSRSRWASAAWPESPWSLPSVAGPKLATNEPRSVSSFTADHPNTVELGSRQRFSAMKRPTLERLIKPALARPVSLAKSDALKRPASNALGLPCRMPLCPKWEPCEPGSSSENNPRGTLASRVPPSLRMAR